MENEELRHKPNSIEVSRTAKGEYTWKIKVYYGNIFIRAMDEIKVIDKGLKAHFPVRDMPK